MGADQSRGAIHGTWHAGAGVVTGNPNEFARAKDQFGCSPPVPFTSNLAASHAAGNTQPLANPSFARHVSNSLDNHGMKKN